jgi:hypothetical protein
LKWKRTIDGVATNKSTKKILNAKYSSYAIFSSKLFFYPADNFLTTGIDQRVTV